jgi:predicted enzyme related to lactoylglutathione lyase
MDRRTRRGARTDILIVGAESRKPKAESRKSMPTPMPPVPSPGPSLFCVEMRTARWAEMVEWYRSALGLRVLVRGVDDGYALLAAGDTRLAILARPAAAPASPRWSLAFEVDDLDMAHARLVAAGAGATPPAAHPEGFRELTLTDPDGNRLRLFAWAAGHPHA